MRRTGLSRTTVSSLVGDLIASATSSRRPTGAARTKGGSGKPPPLVALTVPAGVVAASTPRSIPGRVADWRRGARRADRRTTSIRRCRDAGPRGPHGVRRRRCPPTTSGQGHVRARAPGPPLGAPGHRYPPGWRGSPPRMHRRLGVPVRRLTTRQPRRARRGRSRCRQGLDRRPTSRSPAGSAPASSSAAAFHRARPGSPASAEHVGGRTGLPLRQPRGCLETLVSASRRSSASCSPAYDGELSRPGAGPRARDGDAGVRRVFRRRAWRSAAPLADLCNNLNLEVLVVGGSLRGRPPRATPSAAPWTATPSPTRRGARGGRASRRARRSSAPCRWRTRRWGPDRCNAVLRRVTHPVGTGTRGNKLLTGRCSWSSSQDGLSASAPAPSTRACSIRSAVTTVARRPGRRPALACERIVSSRRPGRARCGR